MFRRFGPLMVCLVLGLSVLVARLYEVSVEEHGIWAREAASLERSAHLVPYRRGRILDRQGREWVRDQVRYEIEFVWRDFRRGHPVGNIAQLMSLTLMRPVGLAEVAGGDAALWGDHLVSLSPDEIREFGRGGALRVGGVDIEELLETDRAIRREERRPARAAALRFYIERLLQVNRKEWSLLRNLRDSDRSSEPYVQLVAGLRNRTDESSNAATQRLRRELRSRVDQSLVHLEELGQLVQWDEIDGITVPGSSLPAEVSAQETYLLTDSVLDRVVQVLDTAREEAENLAADRLFLIAAGFPAGHLSKRCLEQLDLGWLQKCLYWDEPRLDDWRQQRGSLYETHIRQFVAGYVFARMQLAEGGQAERVLDALAHEFVFPADRPDLRTSLVLPWQKADRLRVLTALPLALEEDIPTEWISSPVLPVQDPVQRTGELQGLELLDAMLTPHEAAFGGRREREVLAELLLALPGKSRRRTDWKPKELEPVELILLVWNDELTARVTSILDALPQPVRFSQDAIRAALEDRDHVIKDMSSRPLRFTENPSEEMVHHVERYHQDYAGLVVKSVRSRSPEALVPSEDDTQPDRVLGATLVGKVRSPKLVSLLERGARDKQAKELFRKVKLDEQDREFVKAAAADSYLPSQTVGGSGIEGYFDPELRGRNGFREVVGLQESRGKSGRPPMYRAPQDGQDLQLTVDFDIQRAAEQVINHPELPPIGEQTFDPEWYEDPVGAIVLLTPDGQVLAAASAPVVAGEGGLHQDGQRKLVLDRALRMPTFQPPGSILKPLVAAYGLEYLGLNPDKPRVICHWSTTTKKKKWSGFGDVGCHNLHGHTPDSLAGLGQADIHLNRAIQVSCNTYFAELGDNLFGEGDFQEMLELFGIGQRTGILNFGLKGRSGWLEEYDYGPQKDYSPIQRQRLGNGLSHVTATPMQMARAYAGLATGNLPDVRVVSHIGGVPVPAKFEPLAISEPNLRVVRNAMNLVVNVDGGSAHGKRLSEAELGYRFIAKTGSADYIPKDKGMVPDKDTWKGERNVAPDWVPGVRKHTWVAGWLPADNPKIVAVVYIHDTSTTSSHGAVFVMSQILRSEAVQAYLGGEQ